MLANRVKESSTTTGTGNITLSGTTAGFQTFTSKFSTDETFTYTIESDSNQWEIGVGHLSSSTLIVRDEIKENSEGTTVAIDFTGTLSVFVSSTTFEAIDTPYATADLQSVGTRMDGHLGASSFNNITNYAGGIFVAGYFFTGRKVSSLGVGVGVLDAGETATPTTKIALFSLGDDGLPGKLIVQTGLIAADSTGFIWGSITTTYIPAGPYFMAVLTQSATAQWKGPNLNTSVCNWQSSEEFRPRHEQLVEASITTFSDNPTVTPSAAFSSIPDLRTRA